MTVALTIVVAGYLVNIFTFQSKSKTVTCHRHYRVTASDFSYFTTLVHSLHSYSALSTHIDACAIPDGLYIYYYIATCIIILQLHIRVYILIHIWYMVQEYVFVGFCKIFAFALPPLRTPRSEHCGSVIHVRWKVDLCDFHASHCR